MPFTSLLPKRSKCNGNGIISQSWLMVFFSPPFISLFQNIFLLFQYLRDKVQSVEELLMKKIPGIHAQLTQLKYSQLVIPNVSDSYFLSPRAQIFRWDHAKAERACQS